MPAFICADGVNDFNSFNSRSTSMPVSFPGQTSYVQSNRYGSGSFRQMYDGASPTAHPHIKSTKSHYRLWQAVPPRAPFLCHRCTSVLFSGHLI